VVPVLKNEAWFPFQEKVGVGQDIVFARCYDR